MSFSIHIGRPRSRLQYYAVLGLTACAISYMVLWNDETIPSDSEYADGGLTSALRENRELAFLDDTKPPAKLGYYQSSPQFSALTQPSRILTKYQRKAAPYNPIDKSDSTCDDILLYMPHTIAHKEGHGGQLLAYILAAMIATFSNKAMVVMEAPYDKTDFKGASQFGCPKDARRDNGKGGWTTNLAIPTGLSRLQRHPEWLSNKCPIPCQAAFSYAEWDNVRESRKSSIYYPHLYTANEVECTNTQNSRKTKVLVVGGDEVRDYFDGHFREKMLERPASPESFSWAMRLGALPEEADAFVKLTDERQIWDYIAALMARSGVIRFQPWIGRDIEAFIKEGDLPLEDDYDVIHVRRGDMLAQGEDHEAMGHVKAFWSDKGFSEEVKSDPNAKVAPSDYIPFSHYLTQYDDMECNDSPRTVYIASDDPWEVKKEIEEMTKDDNGIVSYKDDCHKFKFILNHYMNDSALGAHTFHLHDGPVDDQCEQRYQRNIASVSDMMIAAKSDMFIGEMNSGWSRLVRIFRMQLKDATGDGEDEVAEGASLVQRRMKIAWGNDPPLPPGL